MFGVMGEEKVSFKNVDVVDLWFPISGTPSPVKSEK